MAMSELKQRLLKAAFARFGFFKAQYDEKQDAVLANPADAHVMGVKDDGSVFYYAEHDHLAYEIRRAAEKIGEIVAAWEKAAANPVEDSSVSNFRILSEYNNVVLAARDDSALGFGYGLNFVTWKRSPDRKALEHGHYTTDYEGAKEDFAVRCGLIDRDKLFSETEMRLIRQGLVYLGADFPDLTYEQNTLLSKVVEKIETLVPEIREHEELEREVPLPNDELEL
ncbi:MAG: hypothetical protein LBK56_04550 [Gracilibacteraceae bacterium]|nr:hypothetical protein [Gracilibacteraceae bacterium]